jgi:GNAT superfamily N-acetyltransferase
MKEMTRSEKGKATIAKVIGASNSEQIAEAREIFREYASTLGIDLCFQNFEKELAELPGHYIPPSGRLLLLYEDADLAGCVALRKISDTVCEMKRLFVRDRFRGAGVGRRLAVAIIREAKEIGYERMRLDTLPPMMNDAINLYRSLGFKEIDAYYNNPVPGAIFMELELVSLSVFAGTSAVVSVARP